MTTQIVIADDHPLFRSAIANLLVRLNDEIQVNEVEDFSELVKFLEKEKKLPSLILLDLKLPDTQGVDGLLFLKKQFPALPVVIVSGYDDTNTIHNTMQYGASGFIPKSLDIHAMGEAILQILDGDLWFPQIVEMEQEDTIAFEELTTAQLKVLALLKDGKPSKEMARIIGVTEATIKAHLTVIFRKLNVNNRTQAVLAAKKLDIRDFSL